MREKLNRSDWLFLAVCLLLAAGSLFVVLNWFTAAFPEASLDLRVDRQASLKVAEPLLQAQKVSTAGLKHTITFDSDDDSRIFLERSVGLAQENAFVKRGVHLWSWHHRWFKPLQEEEWQVDVAPTGEITGYVDHLPEDRAVPDVDAAAARALAEGFLRGVRVSLGDLQLVENSERLLPHRTQRIFTWESQSLRPAGAPYRTIVVVDGNRVTRFSQGIKVPDGWSRQYRELRSKNNLAGGIDTVFLALTIIFALVVFVVRLRRGDVSISLVLGIAAVTLVLGIGNALNSFPGALAGYDTATSYPAFLAQFTFLGVLIPAFGAAMFLVVISGAGEVLFRERLPQHIAIPRIWTLRALTSKKVFRSFVLGYSLVAFFLAYQVAFYLIAGKFGAWAPAEVPYDEMLSSRFPWVAVLFAGFFPALSEEFMSRAFSIPFFEKIFRSRIAAIIVAGFIWGFGHATYPNQPFYIRGVEVGLAGVLLGFLLFRFGLLPLLIWHYTVDALYTALLLFRSGNRYYVVSAGLASLVFAIPMVLSIVAYVRNKGFIPDDDLTNATLPTSEAPAAVVEAEVVALPEPIPVAGGRIVLCLVALAIVVGLAFGAPQGLEEAVDYRITREQAIDVAMGWLRTAQHTEPLEKRFAFTDEGFRSWERSAPTEEGGSPGGFDSIAAQYMARHGMPVRDIVTVMQERVKAATFLVRTYTPMQKREYRMEVDPRTAKVIGYHRLQDEKMPGPRLEQPQAEAVALAAFPSYGYDAKNFEVKEALNFQQPARRDWLFHFQEKTPLVADAWRRVSVRVTGNDVAQFSTTVKIPDAEYRQESERGLLNVALLLGNVLGGLSIFALMIAGLILATRKGHFPWRRALGWTLALSFIPIADGALRFWESQSHYDTSVQWQTFLTGDLTGTGVRLGGDLGILFLSLVGLLLVFPFALELGSREARARFGRSAAVAALTAVAVLLGRHELVRFLESLWPQLTPLRLNVPQFVALPLPAFFTIGNAALRAIEISGAIALYWIAVAPFQRRFPWVPATVTMVALFCSQLDRDAAARQMPLMLLDAVTFAVVIWLVARYILSDNLLAWPLTAALLFLLQDAAGMLANQRPDLTANAAATLGAATALLLWVVLPGATARSHEPSSTTPADSQIHPR